MPHGICASINAICGTVITALFTINSGYAQLILRNNLGLRAAFSYEAKDRKNQSNESKQSKRG
jgi:hypothetical protein